MIVQNIGSFLFKIIQVWRSKPWKLLVHKPQVLPSDYTYLATGSEKGKEKKMHGGNSSNRREREEWM